jgi:iron(III) transport system ATP-binding protein
MPSPRLEPVGIDIRGVNLSYGTTHVLKDVNLDIRPGEFFAFLGPSGCGKTTLLRLIAGFNTSRTGTVTVGGGDISALPPWKRDVGMVFQSYALWPHMTVRRNVAFGLEERKVPRAEIETRVKDALDLVGLGHLADRRPSQLSGGQQQRVALARTIVVRPKVLLLDEPLSNLDAKLRVQVRREIRDLQQTLGLTTIFVTHDQEEANTICDRIAVMNEGVIQQVGTPMDLYDRPANLFVATFLGTANVLSGTIEGSGASRMFALEGGGAVPVAADTPDIAGSKLVFRPQNAAIVAAGAPTPPGATRLSGTLAHREFLGASIRYAVKLAAGEVLIDVAHLGGSAHEVGSPIDVAIDPASTRVLAA